MWKQKKTFLKEQQEQVIVSEFMHCDPGLN